MGQDGSVTTSARPGRDVPTLVARAREGDPRSVARLISLVEDASPAREPEGVLDQRVFRVATHPENLWGGHKAEYCRAL